MAWPPSPASNFIVNAASSGSTSLVWGTDSLYNQSTSAIVKSCRRQGMVEEIMVPNGTGLTAWHVMLIDGVEMEMTIVWDGNGTPLTEGTTVSLRDPNGGGSGTSSTYDFIITSAPINLNRKQEGEWSLTAKYFSTGIIG